MKLLIILMIELNGEVVELVCFVFWCNNFYCVLQWFDEVDVVIEGLLQCCVDGEMQLLGMIFLDLGMMENNGLDFIQVMKVGCDMCVVLIVVFLDSDYLLEMFVLLEVGVVEYLFKFEMVQQFMEVVVDCVWCWSKWWCRCLVLVLIFNVSVGIGEVDGEVGIF